jgi:hypothetical protein
MRTLILIFLVVIAAGGVAGASGSDAPPGLPAVIPPTMPSDVICAPWGDKGIRCFYPAHDR